MMDDEENIIWINLPKYSEGYISGVEVFLQNTFPKFSIGDEIKVLARFLKMTIGTMQI